MRIVNDIAACTSGMQYKLRDLKAVSDIVIHRCAVGATGRDSAKAFAQTGQFQAGYYTGGKFPYHFFVCRDGTVEQCVPLSFNAPAALPKLNKTGIHVAVCGNFRGYEPAVEQWQALIALCSELEKAFNYKLKLRGHTEESDASSSPNKQCPGRLLSMAALRTAVVSHDQNQLVLRPSTHLASLGVHV